MKKKIVMSLIIMASTVGLSVAIAPNTSEGMSVNTETVKESEGDVEEVSEQQADEREKADVIAARNHTGRWEVIPVKAKKKPKPKKRAFVPCSASEFTLMTQVVYAESGNQGEHGMRLVADCIINQWRAGIADSIYGVLTYKNNFATVRNGRVIAHADEVTDLCRKVCREELKKQTDTTIMFFRTDHYHPFGTPAYKHKDHYFSRR